MLAPPALGKPSLLKFLKLPTPKEWLLAARINLPILLIDHAHCERKAAAMAISLISKYPEKSALLELMSPLAREELLHFEKVLLLLRSRQIKYRSLPSGHYAQQLHQLVVKKNTDERLRDKLLVGAIIEARSCERFQALAPYLEDRRLANFYASLAKAEVRHFENYLHLAKCYGGDISERLEFFIKIENQLISMPDKAFRFHSGIPEQNSIS